MGIDPYQSSPEDAEYFYRYEEVRYSSGVDEFDNPFSGYILKVELREYFVVRRTPKGAWISYGSLPGLHTPERFVLLDARKRFACSSKEEALESFVARKRRQIGILKNQLRGAERALDRAEFMQKQGLEDDRKLLPEVVR